MVSTEALAAPPAHEEAGARQGSAIRPLVALGLVAGLAGALFALLATLVPGPDVFGDEMTYMEAATSFAAGHGLRVREGPYGFGPGFPVLAGLVLRAVPDRVAAYHTVLALNGVLFASAAAPVYVLGRRLLAPRGAAVAAGMCLLLPSTFYAASFMTEALGFVAALWALAAVVAALERPTVARQGLVLIAVALATAVRPQFVALLPTYLLGLAIGRVVGPRPRPPLRAQARRWWPTWAGLALAAAAGAAYGARSGSLADVLGSYDVLWRRYDLVSALAWTAWHAFDLSLYLVLVPVVALPAMLAWAGRQARSSAATRAFLSVFVAANAVALAVVGVFSSSAFGGGRLHDRYVLYVVPLWLVLLVAWIAAGAPRTRRLALAGGAAVLALVVLAPVGDLVQFEAETLFDAPGTTSAAVVRELSGSVALTRVLLVAGVAAAVALVARLPASRSTLLGVVVAVGLLVPAWGMWARATLVGDHGLFVPRTSARMLWVDERVRDGRTVVLFTRSPSCRYPLLEYAFIQTEFFNASVGAVLHLGREGMKGFGLPERRAVLGPGGTVVVRGRPVKAAYVITAPGVPVQGRVVARGTTAGLVLWRVNGTVRLRAADEEQALAAACSAAAASS